MEVSSFISSLTTLLAILLSNLAPSKAGTIAQSLKDKLSNGVSTSNAVLELPSVLDRVLSNPGVNLLRGTEKANLMTTLLKQFTSASQAPFMSIINRLGAGDSATTFYITNMISIKNVNLPLINALAAVPGPFTIREPFIITGNEDSLASFPAGNISTQASRAQWGVSKIEAPYIWDTYNIYGEGILVANIDTGVYKDHESLRDNYGGGWLDAVNGKPEPYDDFGHGTHVMGTICGRSRAIGVAPGASWIACKALNSENRGSSIAFVQCGQWMMEQRPLPHVICNSWGGPGGDPYFNDVIRSWRALDIIPVFAIGNSGSRCGTAGSPGNQDNVISVGATDMADGITSFSSRGPSPATRKIKPEVSAPGFNIWSAGHRGEQEYVPMNGTSMAAPHVTGAIALMIQANPSLTFNDILARLTGTAERPPVAKADLQCGLSRSRQPYPNNAYGYGRINIRKAIEAS